MTRISDEHPDLEWTILSDLEVGEAYTLSTESPLTFLMLGKFKGRNGRPEYDVTTLVGPAQGRASTRTYFRGDTEVLVVPTREVGHRVAFAAKAFSNREFRGRDRVELGPDCWPQSLATGTADEVEVSV